MAGFLTNLDIENEDDDPVGPPPADPAARFTAAAVELNIIRQGDKLDQNLVELCLRVVEMAASIGDRYGDDDFGNAGQHIRAELSPQSSNARSAAT